MTNRSRTFLQRTSAGAVVSPERVIDLAEAAYDEHAQRLATLYVQVGMPVSINQMFEQP